ncbi:TadE/TadG family type IV pilus assembly protein [Terriglobus sp. RCC_193]|uniref:TadE/TadG family type IV pilus assembly protein n=1 Tax=Terriglobus sp. RCC_193 TaxID=3239218 RepID=UPI003525DEA1
MRRAKFFSAQRLARHESGSTLLEMALCLSLVSLVMLGIVECSLAVYTEHYVESAALSGARYATVRGSTYSGTACASASSYQCMADTKSILTYIQSNSAPGIVASQLSVTASWPGTTGGGGVCDVTQGNGSPGCVVTVTVSYPFTFMLPAPLHKSITFRSSRSSVISQ